MAISLGNDISRWQGDVNYDVFKNNTQFVIIKATEGKGFTDPKFSRNQSEARRVGLPLGYYHFARPDLKNSGRDEADYFLSVIGSPVEGEVYVLDYEPASNPGDVVAWCKEWLDRVLEKTGVKSIIYLNQAQVKAFNWKPIVDAGYGLWIAAYLKTKEENFYSPYHNAFEKGAWPFAAIQQWTNAQNVPGISGNVDGNVFFGDIATFKKYGYHKSAEPTPTPEPQPSTEVEQLKKDIEQRDEKIKQLESDSAKLTQRAEKAEATAQTQALKIEALEENIKQNGYKIKQFKDSVKQSIDLFNSLGGEE